MAIQPNVRGLRRFVGVVVGVGMLLTCAQNALGQVAYELLHGFAREMIGCPDGLFPLAGLVQGTDGSFYGTTSNCGVAGGGTVFRITAAGTFTTLHSFAFDYNEGCQPEAGLIQASDGDFYGTTSFCGAYGGGTVFRMKPAGALTTLHSFGSGDDGSEPVAGLIEASDGNFYGTTRRGGASSYGTVYKITAKGEITTLHSFDTGSNTEGYESVAGLIQASDGDFYGTTTYGGAFFCGTVFKITAAGSLTTLRSLQQTTDGCFPRAGLIQATDGSFYGTTSTDGSAGAGSVFKITAAGALTTLHSFGGGIFEGSTPAAGLIQASDGNFYGTTEGSGAFGNGTVFKITAAGALTTLYSFAPFGVGGALPVAGLIQATDGNLYAPPVPAA
jgi:uncharacterized repeat protein (TIGR03803 family)